MVERQRALVQPRVHIRQSPGGRLDTESPLAIGDALEALLEEGLEGIVGLIGPIGAGKSTALRHLAALAPEGAGVRLVDDPLPGDALAAGPGLTIYASREKRKAGHAAILVPQPWGTDEHVEYLLGARRERCADVMARIARAPDLARIDGNPELTRILLDRMSAEGTLAAAGPVLEHAVWALFGEGEGRRRAEVEALGLAVGSQQAARLPEGGWGMTRALQHRPIQLLLAGARLAAAVREGQFPDFTLHLPRDLVNEVARRLAPDPDAEQLLAAGLHDRWYGAHPMVASVLHALGRGWRPAERTEGQDLRWFLAGAYLGGARWAGAKLVGAQLGGASLVGADLEGANLIGADLRHAQLGGARLRGAALAGVTAEFGDLGRADLTGANLARAALHGAVLTGARLESGSLIGASLAGADLRGARFDGADLTSANLTGAKIDGADFSGARLDGANLSRLALHRARFGGASFRHANLDAADLEGMDLRGCVFDGARLRCALLTGANLRGASLQAASLNAAALAEVDLEGADLLSADLRRATFHMGSSRSGLVGSDLASEGSRTGFYTDDSRDQSYRPPEEIRKANLRGANLIGAAIEGVDFYLVDLRDARFTPKQALILRRTGAILETPTEA